MKRRAKELPEKERMKTLNALYTAAGTLKGRDDAKAFLRELLTESECIMLGRRILIARALLSGATYDSIVDEYHVGKDTINKIAHWLEDKFPGYELVIAEMEKEMSARKQGTNAAEELSQNPLGYLKRRYPMHFLFFPDTKKDGS